MLEGGSWRQLSLNRISLSQSWEELMVREQKKMRMIALRGLTVLPHTMVHLDISRKLSLETANQAMNEDQMIFLVCQKDKEMMHPEQKDLYQVGTIAKIRQIVKIPAGPVRVLVEGLERARLEHMEEENSCLIAEICLMEEEEDGDKLAEEAMMRIIREHLVGYISENPKASKELQRALEEPMEIGDFLDYVAANIGMMQQVRQQYLEQVDIDSRYQFLLRKIFEETSIYHLKREFQEKIKLRVDKNQKEYILREQLRLIYEELGEGPMQEADQYTNKMKELSADKKVKEKIEKEIKRFRAISPGSPELGMTQTYIETLLSMPWNKATRESIQLKRAEKILNEDHYGLEKVKERIIEHLAVRKLNGKGETPMLCLVGPPGTGKTSIARSIARALGKKYVRICLGGVRDEAEIRGHRRTYIGAMPGRIATAIRQAGVKNPLMLLDEIDKVSSDYKGDTSSALLEVLDNEQNSHFRDHYLELPLDLSSVLFIATANTTDTIARPLLDRMEVIEVQGYTENEKYHIATDYLLPKQQKKNGMKDGQIIIEDEALRTVIRNYTREAGVRSLERKIGSLCRKAARQLLETGQKTVQITVDNLEKYLGKKLIDFENANETDEVGIVRGLAWTSVGGDTLQIEVNLMPGKGVLQMTGQLGDVMKESAQTALTYIRSICPNYNVPADFFETHDIHIHIPEGAVPKDGPSAGITMATALLSAVINQKVRADVAMTGEITLRGRVLPIGGLKEKLLAAKTAHMKTVIVPEKNRPDVAELSEEIVGDLEISYVKTMNEVIETAFVKQSEE